MGLSVQDTSITLDSWYKVWLDTYKRQLLKNNSIVNYRNVYEKHISPALGDVKLSRILHADIQKLINQKIALGYSYSVCNRIRITYTSKPV